MPFILLEYRHVSVVVSVPVALDSSRRQAMIKGTARLSRHSLNLPTLLLRSKVVQRDIELLEVSSDFTNITPVC